MNIIVCNDSRSDEFPEHFDWSQPDSQAKAKAKRMECSLDGGLCELLQKQGHIVEIFDGYQDDCLTRITDANVGASILAKRIRALPADGLVFDLNYFGDFNYGLNMLRHIRELGMLRDNLIIVVYTHFKNEKDCDYPHKLIDELGIPKERVVDRLLVNMKNIPSFFR